MTDKKYIVRIASGGGSGREKDGGAFIDWGPTVVKWSEGQDPNTFNPSEHGVTPMLTEDNIKSLCAAAETATLKQRIEALEARVKNAYADCLDAVNKVKTDAFTEAGVHQKIESSAFTAKDFMVAMAEDIELEIKRRATLLEREDDNRP